MFLMRNYPHKLLIPNLELDWHSCSSSRFCRFLCVAEVLTDITQIYALRITGIEFARTYRLLNGQHSFHYHKSVLLGFRQCLTLFTRCLSNDTLSGNNLSFVLGFGGS
jgi:hypothetical protein